MCIEGPGGQSIQPIELAGIRDPFVDEDQAWRMRTEQVDECLPRVRPGAVGVRDERKPFGTPELPGQLTPQRPHLGSIGLHGDGPGLQAVSDDDGRRRLRCGSELGVGQHALYAGKVGRGVPASEMQQGDQ
jgi:hypothetical protein